METTEAGTVKMAFGARRRSHGVIVGIPAAEPVLASRVERDWAPATRVAAAAGLSLLIVAWTHLALIWIPASFGTAPWEYAAATQSVDVFPLALMGMTFLSVCAILREWNRRTIVLAIVSLASALALLFVATLIALNLPIAWGSVAQRVRSGVMKTGGKAFVFALLFAAYHTWLGIHLLRARSQRGSRSQG